MPEKSIREFDLNAFSGRFRSESDRACAVLGAALLDACLEGFYRRRIHKPTALLKFNGPLGTLSARIQLAYAVGWIAEDVRFDLDQIRRIRNKFAHNFDHELTFEDQSIAAMCRTLRVAKVLLEANEDAASKPHPNLSAEVIRSLGALHEPPRARFEISVEMLAQHLDELAGAPSEYSGPSLGEQLWNLGSRITLRAPAQTGSEPATAIGAQQFPPQVP